MRYFIVDSGEEMLQLADVVMRTLKDNEFHYINYLTNEPYYLAVEEVNEDTFLAHFKNIKE